MTQSLAILFDIFEKNTKYLSENLNEKDRKWSNWLQVFTSIFFIKNYMAFFGSGIKSNVTRHIINKNVLILAKQEVLLN